MQAVSESIHSYISRLRTMPKPSIFSEKKRKILQELNRPDEEYKDLSPIGAVDPNIRQLVDQINDAYEYVTTSSCAGRISVFLEGAAKPKSDHDDQSTISSSNQGKGGGQWLFVSHDPVDLRSVQDEGALLRHFQLFSDGKKISFPPASTEDKKIRFVHFKFEPMVSASSLPSLILSFSYSFSSHRYSTSSHPRSPQPNVASLPPCLLDSANQASLELPAQTLHRMSGFARKVLHWLV